MCVCVLCRHMEKFWKRDLFKHTNSYRCVCSFCMCPCTCAQCDPQGQKSRRMRVYNTTTTNNNSEASPEQRVNMDTMETHYAIMAGFMHFSLAGWMEREGEIKENRRRATGKGESIGEGQGWNEREEETKCWRVKTIKWGRRETTMEGWGLMGKRNKSRWWCWWWG